MKLKQKTVAFFFYTLVVLCAACKGPFMSDTEQRSLGTIRLTIHGFSGDSQARTIFPDNPVFSMYRLSFEALDNQEPKPDMEIPVSNGESTIHGIDLEPGNWKITVYGQITINGAVKEVAEGTSGVIYVIANENMEVTITLQSKLPDAGTGEFSWSITVPQGMITGAYVITLAQWDDETKQVITSTGVIDTEQEDCIIAGSQEIDAGYYLLTVSIGDDKQRAFYVDIVHILTDRSSRFDYTMVSSDFVPVIHLSGTVHITVIVDQTSRPHPNITEVWAYSAVDNEKIGVAVVHDNTWNMDMIEMPEETAIYFSVLCTIPGSDDTFEIKTDTVRSVYQSDISGIDLQDTFTAVVLSGTLVPKGITNAAQWEVRGYTDPQAIASSYIMATPAQSDANGRWSKIVPAFDAATEVYFSIQDPTGLYRRINLNKTTVHDTNVSDIIITGYFTPPEQIKISGTLPGMAGLDNWTNPELFLSKGGSKFTYTYTHTALGSTSYTVNFLANFDPHGNASWDASADSIVTYNYDGVAELSEKAPEHFDFSVGTNRAITWFNYSSSFTIKTLKFTLDFQGETYFSVGKPTLLIERRSEVRIIKPAASFIMGSPPTEQGRNGPSGMSSETQHAVQFSHDYWMMETEVSQKTYQELVPTYTNTNSAFKHDNYPVVYISWLDAVAFANELSKKDGLNPVYTIRASGVSADWLANGWRLPTEAEWEYAARGGTATPFGIDPGTTLTTDLANYNGLQVDDYNPVAGRYAGHIVDVYTYRTNQFGLYNMHGNVWEFCWDYYADYRVSPSPQQDPRGYDTATGGWENGKGNGNDGKTATDDQGTRIIRGGSYFCSPRFLRSAHRGTIGHTENTYNDIGFRLVRIVE
jgi:formylglycine-generating enzyme required for sulfatase activity